MGRRPHEHPAGYLLAGRLADEAAAPPRRRPPRAVGIDTDR